MAPPAPETRFLVSQEHEEGPSGHGAPPRPGPQAHHRAEKDEVNAVSTAVAPRIEPGYSFAVPRFLHTVSAVLFTVLGLALFGAEVLWRQGLWMPWSLAVLTTIPAPLIAVGLLYGGLSIALSAKEGGNRAVVGSIVGAVCIALFAAFAVLRLWPLS